MRGGPVAALVPVLSALEAWQQVPDLTRRQELDAAANRAHHAFIEAFKARNFSLAAEIIEGLQVLAQEFYSADPISLHGLRNDYGALLVEQGQYGRAMPLLKQALDAAAKCGEHASTFTLKTLATFIGAAQSAGDDALVDTLLAQAAAAAPLVEVDALTRFKLDAAKAYVMLARGRTADAEQLLRNLPAEFAEDELHAPEASRCWALLAQSYAGRQLYGNALEAHRKALAIIERHPGHPHARANALCMLAQTHRRIASGKVFSRPWWRSRLLFMQALHLQRRPNPPSPSAGWTELSALALMALRERRLLRARTLHHDAVMLARRTWPPGSRPMQDLVLVRVAIDMASRKFKFASRRLKRVLAALQALGPGASASLANARALQAELLLRTGARAQAARVLERLALRDFETFALSVGVAWTAYEIGLARHVVAPHAFADAILSGEMMTPRATARLFRVLAHSQDMGLRTLRQLRGAAPAVFKAKATAKAVANVLPENGVFVQIFRRMRRMERFDAAEWQPGNAAYIALVVHAGSDEVFLADLGSADELDGAVETLLSQMEANVEHVDQTALDLLYHALWRHIQNASYVFFAPDGALHAFPFSMLMRLPGSPPPLRVAILVESAARLIEQRREGERIRAFNSPCVLCAPDCGKVAYPYQQLPEAYKEAMTIGEVLGKKVRLLPATIQAKNVLVTSLNAGHDLIHFCGHADVFKPDDKKVQRGVFDKKQLASLLSSGDVFDRARLILGGFNDWVAGDGTVPSPDDASLSATELAAMRLPNVRLLTLSACHGGRGADRQLEAPASLATAARFAGVGVVVAALWPVDDRATALLMQLLYDMIEKCGSTAVALRCAQEYMAMFGYPASDWAAFVVWADTRDLPRI